MAAGVVRGNRFASLRDFRRISSIVRAHQGSVCAGCRNRLRRRSRRFGGCLGDWKSARKMVTKYPLLRPAIAFAAGIFVARWVPFNWGIGVWAAALLGGDAAFFKGAQP